MMVPPSKEYLKKDKEFWENARDWLIVNPDTGQSELKPGTPQELVELRQWLFDNDPAKDFPFED